MALNTEILVTAIMTTIPTTDLSVAEIAAIRSQWVDVIGAIITHITTLGVVTATGTADPSTHVVAATGVIS